MKSRYQIAFHKEPGMFFRAVFYLILVILPSALSAQQLNAAAGNWTSLGPSNLNDANGRIDFITVSPVDSNTIWTGSHTGGLWKSTDAGQTWNTLTDQEPFIGCYDVAISNANPDVMYMATGTFGGGEYANDIAIKKSIDGGQSWLTTGLSFSSCCEFISNIEIDPSDNDVVLATTSDGIYKSMDGGANWIIVQPGRFIDFKYKPGNPSVIYAAEDGVGARFFTSMNGGFTFSPVSLGLPDSSTDILGYKIGISNASPEYIYLFARSQGGAGFKGIFRSIDGGLNFSRMDTVPAAIQILSGAESMCIDVNPLDANDVFVGSDSLYHSMDGGMTWTTVNAISSNGFHAISFRSSIFCSSDGGFYKSANGSSWNYSSDQLQVGQMNRIGSGNSLMLAGQEGNGVLLSNNGTWSRVLPGDGTECIVDFQSPSVMYATTAPGNVFKSINGGGSFSQIVFSDSVGVHEPGYRTTPFIMNPADNNTLLMGKRHVYRTDDGGSTWNSLMGVSDSIPLVALTYANSNPNYIYAATEFTFYACTNGSLFSSRAISFPGKISSIAVSSTDPEKVWVSMTGFVSGNNVYVSEDAGVSWNDYSTGLPNLPVNCIAHEFNTSETLYAGTDVGVYYRQNQFSDWQSFSNGMPNVQVRELEIDHSQNKIRAATYGRGLWESPLFSTVGTNNNIFEKSFKLFPNPTNGNFTISLDKKMFNEHLKMSIINSFGEVVFNDVINRQHNLFTLNLPGGIYILRIINRDTFFTQKLIIEN